MSGINPLEATGRPHSSKANSFHHGGGFQRSNGVSKTRNVSKMKYCSCEECLVLSDVN